MAEKFSAPEEQPEDTKTMSFDEFSNLDTGHPMYNNYPDIFSGRYDAPSNPNEWDPRVLEIHNRDPKTVYYSKFREEHPELDLKIRAMVARRDEAIGNPALYRQALMEMSQVLYEAYLIMRMYGATDNELFR